MFQHRHAPAGARPAPREFGHQRAAPDHQFMLATQQDRHFVGAEHVVAGQNGFAVQPYFRERGESIEAEHGRAGFGAETRAPPPVLAIKWVHPRKVPASRIAQAAGRRARHAGGKPVQRIDRIACRSGGYSRDFPAAVERGASVALDAPHACHALVAVRLPTTLAIAAMDSKLLRFSISSGNSTSNSPSRASITLTDACDVMPAWYRSALSSNVSTSLARRPCSFSIARILFSLPTARPSLVR